ncbi:hypothetical protein ISCGN_015188 [Ixodes scapularis]
MSHNRNRHHYLPQFALDCTGKHNVGISRSHVPRFKECPAFFKTLHALRFVRSFRIDVCFVRDYARTAFERPPAPKVLFEISFGTAGAKTNKRPRCRPNNAEPVLLSFAASLSKNCVCDARDLCRLRCQRATTGWTLSGVLSVIRGDSTDFEEHSQKAASLEAFPAELGML